jgi:CheY-like chemotaxis protein
MIGAGRNILIVEDDESTLTGWVELLRSAGYLVRGVSSYEEGRQELAAMPDLLITDVRLGVYNGLQLLMRGRMVNPRLQAIVITGYADQIVRREAVYLQAEHLEKPVDADRLLQVVGSALRLPPSIARKLRIAPEPLSQLRLRHRGPVRVTFRERRTALSRYIRSSAAASSSSNVCPSSGKRAGPALIDSDSRTPGAARTDGRQQRSAIPGRAGLRAPAGSPTGRPRTRRPRTWRRDRSAGPSPSARIRSSRSARSPASCP